MDQRDTTIMQLRGTLQAKDVQLKAAVALAGRAAEDLKKYRDLTVKLEGLRQILHHQRNHHHQHCEDVGCEWDLGTLAFLAHSMGMTAPTMELHKLRAMVGQYDAQHAQKTGHVHQFPKGVTDARGPISKSEERRRAVQQPEVAKGSVPESPEGADVQGTRPDRSTTRRLPDKPGSAPQRE